MKRRSFEVPGTSLAALEAGSGPPLLLLHGSVGGMEEFRGNIRRFSRTFRTIALSRRFHPPNPAPVAGDRYTMAVHARDLLSVIDQIDSGPVHVVGSSWGGYAALTSALEAPPKFASLVLAEPPVLPLLRSTNRGRVLLREFTDGALEPAQRAFAEGDGAGGLARFLDGILGRAGSYAALPPSTRNELLRFVPELMLELSTPADDYMPALPGASLAALDMPVLLLEGDRSPGMFGVILDQLAALIPRTSRRKVAGAGHAVHIGNPSGFVRIVAAFLEDAGR